MFRALSILAAAAALAVSAAPVASAGSSKTPPPRGTAFCKQFEDSCDRLHENEGIDGGFIKAKPRSLNTFGGNDTL